MNSFEDVISDKYNELIECSSTAMSTVDIVSIKLAFDIASDIYSKTTTADGRPFILYNLDIAIIAVREIGLGPTSAICALLHGIDQKTQYSIKNIEKDFGEHVAEI
ncbi:MAG: hypothetical protein HQ521_08390, partial [Bacteroidetes bacterium]|nr:hypothetical protein [Bacteroidota bacterium]